MSRNTPLGIALVAVASLASGACDKSSDAPAERAYHAECEVTIEPAGGPPAFDGRGEAANREAAQAAAWAQACPQAGLAADCQNRLPDGLRGNNVGCVSVTLGTGGTITATSSTTGFTCTVRIVDERNPTRFVGVANMEGTREETADLGPLCLQAVTTACAEAGVDGDCTAGDEPAWQVISRGEGRQLTR